MCGIVAAAAMRNIVPNLLEGLKKLEYRGYDSAGLAIISDNSIVRRRAVGRVVALESESQNLKAFTGIAHTRWATHGAPCEKNAHPHISKNIAVVHNGIVENFENLRHRLKGLGYTFESDTDSESIAHLIYEYNKSEKDFFSAVCRAVQDLEGTFSIAVIDSNNPHEVVIACQHMPLLIGLAEDGFFAASDASALLQVTKKMLHLESGDCARLTPKSFEIRCAKTNQKIERPIYETALSAAAVELGNFRHYMQKEIFEQPQAIVDTLEILGTAKTLDAAIFGNKALDILKDVESVLILACGTSAHAGMTARYWLEAIAQIPCTVEIASEYRYRSSVANPKQLVVGISQSGETADTIAAIQHAIALNQPKTLAICNVPESAMTKLCALSFLTRAGPEIGVASTKAFTTQLVALFLLTLLLAKIRGKLSAVQESQFLDELRHLPAAIVKVLNLESPIVAWAKRFANKSHALFLGRGRHYPIALEGALKLKEISYIHAEAYPAGELKHGPLALVDSNMPVIVVAPNDALIDKLKSNLKEVEARGGELYIFADSNADVAENPHMHILRLPEHYGALSPILHVVALQLLAYHAALVKGTDVDKPRNLAKSVTVE